MSQPQESVEPDMPKKLSELSIMIIQPICVVAMTVMVALILVRICFQMIHQVPAPEILAARI